MKTRSMLAVILAGSMMAAACTGCGGNAKDATGAISVISREDGSGTRGAFVELTGVEQDKVDRTINTAEITNSTAVMMTTVEGNAAAIGYISLGALSDSVKAVQVDGVEATAANVENGSYAISRPFQIATKDNISDTAQDFITFIMSADGQKIIEDKKYIPVSQNGAYSKPDNLSGTISVAGSSSVAPVMGVLAEKYMELNPNVKVEVQQSDSTTGMSSAAEGVCDIGMASRDLKDSEKDAGLQATVIAKDGIAVIVNKDNAVSNLTIDQICKIYTGEIKEWSEFSGS